MARGPHPADLADGRAGGHGDGIDAGHREGGEWFQRQLGMPPVADEHARLGQQMLYFVAPLLLSAELLVFAHVRQGRGKPAGRAVVAVIALVAIAAGGAAAWQTYRVGDSGAHAVWNGVVGH